MFKTKGVVIVTALFLVMFAGVSVLTLSAQKAKTTESPKNVSEYADRAREASEVMTQVMSVPEQGIPQDLMEHARAIAVIPHVVKGALGIGGRYGKGLISQRNASGKWGAPSYVEIGGGSVGFQIGVTATDLVLVFTSDDGLKGLLDGKVTLGADASVAAGPVGRSASASTDVKLKSAIYSYSRSKGLFAGVALDGAAITIDDSANRKVYGKDLSGRDILLGGKVEVNSTVAPFVEALQKYSPRFSSR